jgi:DNA ligase-1
MKRFAALYAALDATTKTNDKVAALVNYFAGAPAADAAWAVFLLSGRKLKQLVPVKRLRAFACEAANIPEWLFNECYDVVGDLAETLALLLPDPTQSSDLPLAIWMEQRLAPLRNLPEEEQHQEMLFIWQELNEAERFLAHKLITGAFRVGVSQRLVTRALAEHAGLDAETLAHRLMGDWQPTERFFDELVSPDTGAENLSRPYPFMLAHPFEAPVEELDALTDWQVEWKWDGIRAQVIRRGEEVYLWSRGEELITERFPEISSAARELPEGTVLDGEILGWKVDRPLPFADLQRRIGRKTLTKRILADVPAALIVFDVLELAGLDIRERPLSERRQALEELLAGTQAASGPSSPLLPSPLVTARSWDELLALRQTSREHQAEGFMLKRRDSRYGVGRVRGQWWKWKIEPYTVDAVLIYAQRGSGKRASLYTDYTFGVWDRGQLVPFAKAYSGLTDAEIREVDSFVRRNTLEKFGPVRSVKPELVFELAFENIQRSTRHKSGIAVRFPRIAHWRKDKRADQADSLDTILSMLPPSRIRQEADA